MEKKTTKSILTKLLSINTQVELSPVIQAIINVVTKNTSNNSSQNKIKHALEGFQNSQKKQNKTNFMEDLSLWCKNVGLNVNPNNVCTNNTVIQRLNTQIFKPANSATTDCVVCHTYAGTSHGMGSDDKHHSCRSCGGRICSKTECAIPNFDFWQYPGESFWDYKKQGMGMWESTKTRVEVPKLENRTVGNQTKYKGWICRTCYKRIIPKESSNANNTRTPSEKKHAYLYTQPKYWVERQTQNSTLGNIARITNGGTTCEICSESIGFRTKAWDWCRRCGMIVCKNHLTKRSGSLLRKHISEKSSNGTHVVKNHASNTEQRKKHLWVCNMCIKDDDITSDPKIVYGGKKQRKTPAKKSTVKKLVKKTPAKKTSTKKLVKKSTAKKPTTKKSTAKKSTAKKPTAKKTTAKKPTAKKPIVKKTTAKKPVKKIRKHQGIYQRGDKKGKLKPGFKYSSKKTKTGLKIIIQVKKK